MPIEAITADELQPFKHGFFTRKGGVSTGIYTGLNCGPGSDDDPGSVEQNRRIVAEFMGAASSMLASVHQCHSADVLVVDKPVQKPRLKCDAMVTSQPGHVLGILTADCQPVLFADHRAKVIAAAHAGWKGALAGVLDATIDSMEKLGARRENISAVIGPCISQRAYEVGPEFFEAFTAESPEFDRFFAAGKGDRLMFDLPSFGLFRLRNAGIGSARWTGHCTYSDEDRFFSYRLNTHRNAPDYGRLISTIGL